MVAAISGMRAAGITPACVSPTSSWPRSKPSGVRRPERDVDDHERVRIVRRHQQVLRAGVAVGVAQDERVHPVEHRRDLPGEGLQLGAQIGVLDQPRVRPEPVVGERHQAPVGDRVLGVHAQRVVGRGVRALGEQLRVGRAGVPATQQESGVPVAIQVPRRRVPRRRPPSTRRRAGPASRPARAAPVARSPSGRVASHPRFPESELGPPRQLLDEIVDDVRRHELRGPASAARAGAPCTNNDWPSLRSRYSAAVAGEPNG